MRGVVQLLNHKRSSVAVVGAVLLYLTEQSDWLPEASDTVIYCATCLFGLFILSQTVLDAMRIWKGDPGNGS